MRFRLVLLLLATATIALAQNKRVFKERSVLIQSLKLFYVVANVLSVFETGAYTVRCRGKQSD